MWVTVGGVMKNDVKFEEYLLENPLLYARLSTDYGPGQEGDEDQLVLVTLSGLIVRARTVDAGEVAITVWHPEGRVILLDLSEVFTPYSVKGVTGARWELVLYAILMSDTLAKTYADLSLCVKDLDFVSSNIALLRLMRNMSYYAYCVKGYYAYLELSPREWPESHYLEVAWGGMGFRISLRKMYKECGEIQSKRIDRFDDVPLVLAILSQLASVDWKTALNLLPQLQDRMNSQEKS